MALSSLVPEVLAQILSYCVSAWAEENADEASGVFADGEPHIGSRGASYHDLCRQQRVCRYWRAIVHQQMGMTMKRWAPARFCDEILLAARWNHFLTIQIAFDGNHDRFLYQPSDHTVDWFYVASKQDVVVEALHAASFHSHYRIIELLINHDADVEAIAITATGNHRSPLHECVAQSNIMTAELLLDRGADVNSHAPLVLFEAIIQSGRQTATEKLAMTRLLLERGADPTVRGGNGDSALRVAAHSGCLEVLALLLETEAVVDLDRFVVPWEDDPDAEALTPLMQTSLLRNSAATRLLLQKSASVNAQSYEVPGALCFAITGIPDAPLLGLALRDTMLALLEYGADVDRCFSRGSIPGSSPVWFALQCNNTEAMRLLFKAGADFEDSGHLDSFLHQFLQSDLLSASWLGGQCLLECGVDTNKQSPTNGHTPLTALCSRLSYLKGHETIEALLSHGAEIDLQNAAGETPLFTVCNNQGLKPPEKIHAIGLSFTSASSNIRNDHGNTPLMALCKSTYDELETITLLVNMLLADIDLSNKQGMTALSFAVHTQSPATIRSMVKECSDVDHVDNNGDTAMMIACVSSRPPREKLEILHCLKDARASTRVKNRQNETVLSKIRQNFDLHSPERYHAFSLFLDPCYDVEVPVYCPSDDPASFWPGLRHPYVSTTSCYTGEFF